MKKIIISIFLILCSIYCYSQNNNDNSGVKELTEQAYKFINKVISTGNAIINEVVSETKEYKNDIDECLPEETKQQYRDFFNEVIESNRKGYKEFKRSCHEAFRDGLRGKKYTNK